MFGANDAANFGRAEVLPKPRDRFVIAVFEDPKNGVVGMGGWLKGAEVYVPKQRLQCVGNHTLIVYAFGTPFMIWSTGFRKRNLEPRDWKPMNAAGAGVIEIRVHAGGEYRVLYVAKLKDAVHVPHAFVKKTQKTRQADIELAARRYREAVED